MRVCSRVMRVTGRIFITAYFTETTKVDAHKYHRNQSIIIECLGYNATNIGYSIKKKQFVNVSKVYVDIQTKQNILSLLL